MHHLAVPLIYQNVDLSYHNDAGLFMECHSERMLSGDNPNRALGDLWEKMLQKQEVFIETIIRRPTYGSYISSLTWTYQWQYEEPDQRDQRMWKAFQSLTRVKLIDICSMDHQEAHVIPPPLFPSATIIRVGGRISYPFFRAILAFRRSRST